MALLVRANILSFLTVCACVRVMKVQQAVLFENVHLTTARQQAACGDAKPFASTKYLEMLQLN